MEPIQQEGGRESDPMVTESYWIVQHSWWTEWGDKGLIYIKDEPDNEMGVSGLMFAPAYVDV